MVIILRSPSPPSVAPPPYKPFEFTFSPPNYASTSSAPSPPSFRMSDDSMNVFGARPMDDEWVPVQRRALFKCDGSGHTSGSIAQGCGRLVMEGGVQQHLANCTSIARLEKEVFPPSLPVSKRNLNAAIGGNAKRAKGSKRAGSEASQPLSEAATLNNTPRKIRLTTPASTIADGPSAGGGASAPGGLGVPGTIDDEDGRLWLENGRKETKKQQAKRLAQERRDKKGAAAVPPPGPAAAATEDDASSKKKKDKEFSWDRNCGVITEWNTPCQRKLDCKIHLVADKRAVTGRSMPFDECVRIFKLEQEREAGGGPSNTGIGADGKRKRGDEDDVDELALKPGSSVAGSSSVPVKKSRRRAKAAAEAAQVMAANSTAASTSKDLFEHPELGDAEMATLTETMRVRSGSVCNWAQLRALGMDPNELKTNHIKRKKQQQQQAQQQAAAAAAEEEAASVPAPTPAARPNFDFLQSTAATTPSKATQANDKASSTAPEPAGVSTTAAAAGAAPVKQPTSTMKYQTFAGGATAGVWHISRRSLLCTEQAFTEIWAKISGAKRQAREEAES